MKSNDHESPNKTFQYGQNQSASSEFQQKSIGQDSRVFRFDQSPSDIHANMRYGREASQLNEGSIRILPNRNSN